MQPFLCTYTQCSGLRYLSLALLSWIDPFNFATLLRGLLLMCTFQRCRAHERKGGTGLPRGFPLHSSAWYAQQANRIALVLHCKTVHGTRNRGRTLACVNQSLRCAEPTRLPCTIYKSIFQLNKAPPQVHCSVLVSFSNTETRSGSIRRI